MADAKGTFMDGEEKAETPVRRRPPSQSQASRPPPRSNSGRMFMLLVVLLVLGGVAAWPSIQSLLDTSFLAKFPILQGNGGTGRTNLLANGPGAETGEPVAMPVPMRLDQLERRMAAAEEALRTAGTPSNASLQRLAEELLRLRHDVDGLQRSGDTASVQAGGERAETIGRKSPERKDRAALFLLSIGHLREAVDRGAAYNDEFQSTIAIAASQATSAAVDPALIQRLEILKPFAASGIETRPSLALRYREISNAALRESAVADSDPMIGQFLQWTRSIITVRRAEGGADQQSDTAAANIVKAGRLVAAGDLNTAVAVLQPLHGPGAEAIAPWLKTASARVAVDTALSGLAAAALARNAAGEDTP